jgi:hypothetical protein
MCGKIFIPADNGTPLLPAYSKNPGVHQTMYCSRECQTKAAAVQGKARRIKEVQWQRERQLQKVYGMSLLEYDARVAAQKGRCAICKRHADEIPQCHNTNRLAVDHDHMTGRVRDLLCFRCNAALGGIEKCPGGLDAFRAYLDRHKSLKVAETV